MPDYARTTVVITGPKEDRDRLKQLVEGKTPFDLNKVIPRPATLQFPGGGRVRLSDSLAVEWSFMNWGTKWNPSDSRLIAYKKKKLMYRMSTAWDEPLPVFEKLKEMFPSLTVNLRASKDNGPTYSYTVECGMWAAVMIKYLIELQELPRQSMETPPSHPREDVKPATLEQARQFMKNSSVSVPKQSTPPAAPPATAGQNAPGMNNEGTTQK